MIIKPLSGALQLGRTYYASSARLKYTAEDYNHLASKVNKYLHRLDVLQHIDHVSIATLYNWRKSCSAVHHYLRASLTSYVAVMWDGNVPSVDYIGIYTANPNGRDTFKPLAVQVDCKETASIELPYSEWVSRIPESFGDAVLVSYSLKFTGYVINVQTEQILEIPHPYGPTLSTE